MASYGPSGIGNYGRRPNLGAGIGRGLSSLADRLREIEGQKIRAQQIADQRAYDTEREDVRFQREEQSSLANHLRQVAADEARDTRREGFEIAGEEREVARQAADRERVLGGLGSGLRNSVRGLNSVSNADQTVPAGTFEDFDATQSLLASGDEGLMRGALVDRTLQPGRDAREIGLFRQKAMIDREINPPAPRPYQAPDRITDSQGRILEVLPGGRTRVMSGPDGQPVTAPAPGGNRPITNAQAQRQAFARMARAGATALGDFEEAGEGTLGMGKPTVAQRFADAIPFDAGNVALSDEYQRREASAFQLADAYLRYTSGAAVPEPEVRRFGRAFMPRPGDKPETLAKKREDRRYIVRVLEGDIDPVVATTTLQQRGYQLPRIAPNGIDPDAIDRLYDEVP